jgi:hypothetical protein
MNILYQKGSDIPMQLIEVKNPPMFYQKFWPGKLYNYKCSSCGSVIQANIPIANCGVKKCFNKLTEYKSIRGAWYKIVAI